MAALSLGFVAEALTAISRVPAWNSATVAVRVRLQDVVVPAAILGSAGLQLPITASVLVSCTSLSVTVPVFCTVTAPEVHVTVPSAGTGQNAPAQHAQGHAQA